MDFRPIKDAMEHLALWRTPGNVSVVYKDGEEVYKDCCGYSNIENGEKMTDDKYFYIYSASKITTCLAALQLLEKGVYRLDDPLYDFIPEFRDMYVKKGNDIVKSPRPITIRNLFTMTAGFNYDLNGQAIKNAAEKTNGNFDTLETIKCLAGVPLDFIPGEDWRYSLCHDVLAGFVESVSGKKFSEYVQENIFAPLGIDATYNPEKYMNKMCGKYEFLPEGEENEEKLKRLVKRVKDGYILQGELKNKFILGKNYESGGAGIITTAPEYAKLLGALANGGISKKGERIIERSTIENWRTNQLDGEVLDNFIKWKKTGFLGYGLGVYSRIDESGKAVGEFGWNGAAGAVAIIDVDNNISLFYTQHILPAQNPYTQPLLRDRLYECFK